MSEFKHTPGPWIYDGTGVIRLSDGGTMEVEAWFSPQGHNPYHHERYEEFCANVRLMATAPELFELLSAYVLNEPHLNDDHFTGVQERLRAMAVKALEKAKGESCK